MSDDIDHFSGWVRIVNLTIVSHASQLGKCLHHSSHGVLWNTGSVLLQHGQLRLHAGIINNMTREQVSQSCEEIIAEEGETCELIGSLIVLIGHSLPGLFARTIILKLGWRWMMLSPDSELLLGTILRPSDKIISPLSTRLFRIHVTLVGACHWSILVNTDYWALIGWY